MTVGSPERTRPRSARGGADRRVAVITPPLADSIAASVQDLTARVPASAWAAHLAARRRRLPQGTPLVVIVRNDEEAHRLADDLAAWQTMGHALVLPERAALPLERALPEHEESAERLRVLAELGGRSRDLIVVAPLLAIVQRTISPDQLRSARLVLRVGERVAQRGLLTALVAGGYEPVVEVSGVGEFANRGGLVDIWPPGSPEPLRIELFGDELESLRAFDPMTQASRRRLEQASVLPASEFLPSEGFATLGTRMPAGSGTSPALADDLTRLELGDTGEAAETWAALLTAGPALDHLPTGCHLVLTDPDELTSIAADLDRQAAERRDGLVASGELPATWPLPFTAAATLAAAEGRAAERLGEQGTEDLGYGAAPVVPGRIERLADWVVALADGGRSLVITTDQASRVGELLEEAGRPVSAVAELREHPAPGAIGLVHGSLSGGLHPRAVRPAGPHRP